MTTGAQNTPPPPRPPNATRYFLWDYGTNQPAEYSLAELKNLIPTKIEPNTGVYVQTANNAGWTTAGEIPQLRQEFQAQQRVPPPDQRRARSQRDEDVAPAPRSTNSQQWYVDGKGNTRFSTEEIEEMIRTGRLQATDKICRVGEKVYRNHVEDFDEFVDALASQAEASPPPRNSHPTYVRLDQKYPKKGETKE